MTDHLIQDWNNRPPPTADFLAKLALWHQAVGAGNLDEEFRAYEAMIEAITTPQDLAQFLLEACNHVWVQDIENRTVDRYWDALAGVLVVDAGKPAANRWRHLARMLDKALWYE